MAGIGTTISVVDRMSGPLQQINLQLGNVIVSMQQVDEVSGQMLDDAVPGMESFGNEIENSSKAAGGLEGALGKVLSVASAIAAVKFGIDAVKGLLEVADVQNRSETMLATVMSNMGMNLEQYKEIKQIASDLQGNSIYGDEAILAGAAELASYVTDAEALKTVLSALPTFATGMTGGEELDASGMTDIATQLGKVFNGSYDGIAKKGFVLTEQQKEIIENGTDMEKALAISDIVNESWEGLAENMANTPSGSVIQLKNAWGDVKEVIGNELYPTVQKLANSLSNNLPTATKLMQGAEYILESIINATDYLFNRVAAGFQMVGDNVEQLEVIFASLGAAVAVTFAAIYDLVVPFVTFFANVWEDPIKSIVYLFVDLADTVMEILQTLAESIDKVFGSNLSEGIQGWRTDMYSYWEDQLGSREFVATDIALEDALKAGAEWGYNFVQSFNSTPYSPYDASALFENTSYVPDIEENTSVLKDEAGEVVKIMQELAERDAINRFTTAEVKVELGGVTNNVSSDTDLDGFITGLSMKLEEELSYTAAAYNGDF